MGQERTGLPKIADMHCDTISEIAAAKREGRPCALRENELHIDLGKLGRAGYLVQNFAMFLYLKGQEDPYRACMELIDVYKEEISSNSDRIAEALSYEDILKNEREGKLSALLTIEEGETAMGSLEHLRRFYERGVRMLTLTWNFPNSIGYPNCLRSDGTRAPYGEPNTEQGLTPFGVEFVGEMERLGMIVDVSHLSDAGFYDVCRIAKRPFVASHSNARAVCPHTRNLTDDMIRRLAEHGGVMGLNFCPAFLDSVTEYERAVGTIEQLVRQVAHILSVGGEEVLGLGSDFDGIPTHSELKDASYLPLFADALRGQGYSADTVEKIFCKNVLRVYREVL